MKRFNLILLVGLLSCSRTDRQTGIKVNTVDRFDTLDTLHPPINTIDNYSAAFIYINTDSDSLLLDNGDFGNLIPLYRTKGKLVKEKEYGSDDCAGKYKQFELNGGRLTINKSSCGDYGFSNSQFLIKNDSLLQVRKYEVLWNVANKEFELGITEQIFFFNAGRLTLKERHKTVSDWIGFDLREVPFNSNSIVGHKEYDNLKKEHADLLTDL